MMKIDKAILDTDKVICRNISRFDASERGLLSQNILSQLRNFVEYIAENTCVLSNGENLPISRTYIIETKSKYYDYLRNKRNG